MDVAATVTNFIRESQRVLDITHKPRDQEYRQMASVTALGLVLVGAVGFAITLIMYYLRRING
jgi:protein transport protein SEC61 subunit gamma-like protein